jgi:hypothetical protein
MAFNFQAFLGGVGTGITDVVATKKAEAWDIKKFNMAQDAEERRSARTAAREDAKATEQLMADLYAAGVSDENVTKIMKLDRAKANGIALNATAHSAQDLDANLSFEFATPAGPAADGIPATESSPFKIIKAPKARKEFNSFEAQLSYLNGKLLDPELPTVDATQVQKDITDTVARYNEWKKKDTQNAGFGLGNVGPAVVSMVNLAKRQANFNVDLEGNLIGGFSGREGEYLVADLMGADLLEGMYGIANDQYMNSGISTLREQAGVKLENYAYRTIFDGDSDRLKTATSVNAARDAAKSGAYRVGDVIQVTVSGMVVPMVYTGVPDKTKTSTQFPNGDPFK